MTYQFQLPPWEHQLRALRKAWKKPGFAFLMEMGTGKTKVDIDETCMLFEEAEITAWVIFAPKGVYENWVRGELPTHVPERLREQMVVAIWRAGGGSKANQRQLELALTKGPGLRVLVVNVEAISTPGKARDYVLRFLETHACKISVDEATCISSPSAQRTKWLLQHGQISRYRRILSGLIVKKSPLDLFAPFEFLRPGALGPRSYFAFRARYAVMQTKPFGGRKVQVVVAYKNTEELTEKIQPLSFRVRKEECMDLPPKVYVQRDVELTDEQARIYQQIRDEAISILDGEGAFVSAQSVIVQLIRLQQVLCGYVVDDDGETHDVPTNRVQAVLDAVAETDERVIVWSRFRRDIDRVAAALRAEYGEDTVSEFHGGNVATRQEDARLFCDPSSPRRFMVSNQQTGGFGNTWLLGRLMIYYSNDFSLEKRLQSEDRPHRGGQTEKVTILDLVSRGTVDEKFLETLRKGLDISSQIQGDGYRQWVI